MGNPSLKIIPDIRYSLIELLRDNIFLNFFRYSNILLAKPEIKIY